MIVKNESKVIRRCLDSVSPLIDYWVIVDTGSTDGTQKIIQDCMNEKGIAGELYERPWVNFAHNRNEALKLAFEKSNYLLFIDADEFIEYDTSSFSLPQLLHDYYYINIDLNKLLYKRIQMVNTKNSWQWVGAIHEVLCPSESMTSETLQGLKITSTYEGARSKDPEKYLKDATILEKALVDEPDNTRYQFYLAQSYRDAKLLNLALKHYNKRVEMGGWNEEVFWSKLQIALLHEELGSSQNVIVQSYKDAFQYRPSRVEPLYYLASYLRRNNEYKKSYEISKIGVDISCSDDVLFVQSWIYEYGMLLEYSLGAYWTGEYKKSQEISLNILKLKDLPKNIRECVLQNLQFANVKLLDNAFLPH